MIILKATQERLLAVLQSVAGVVERRHVLPILAQALIRKSDTANHMPAQVEAPVMLHDLSNSVRKLNRDQGSSRSEQGLGLVSSRRRRRTGPSCWRQVADGST
jgi:DNA polymerase III sliding clamp (beta) subunit (PCNA family)